MGSSSEKTTAGRSIRPGRSSISTRRGRAARNPVLHVGGVKAPTAHAESLARQLAAQIRASDRLFVAPDDRRHFEDGQQPVRQFARRRLMARLR